ncbi:DUF3376 domain-containing protein [Mycetocola zhujimingii]|uniref:DUF3376 domain-containing protein n=1 Tax=Mycetocola zhujimingii TaxID=2079792 RepID=UPI0018E07327|nr:DUF3376 domain-containing protein [Mycetocola zhujimingii]
MGTSAEPATLIAVALEPGERPTPRPIGVSEFESLQPRHSRILRAALAMRGGVSLAVWIGGATAEMDLWRRIRIRTDAGGSTHAVIVPPSLSGIASLSGAGSPSGVAPDAVWLDRAVTYARLLDSRGFDAVEFDVLAGASAGGLNAVMYATAQRAGADVDALLPVWRDIGSVWRLLRPPGFERVDSILRGDGYFWPELKDVLRRLYAGPGNHPFHRASRIAVDLSATLIDTADATDRHAEDGNGHFHFVGSDDGSASEYGRAIPSGDGPVPAADLARLAYAARTTSSFPGAFEPALIFSKSTRVPLNGPWLPDAESVDMTFAFHAHRNDWSHPFHVVDGGVLDNIPIDRAFRAVRGMASTVNATRALLYLDPSPPAESLASVRPTHYGRADAGSSSAGPHRVRKRLSDRQSEFLPVIVAALRRQVMRESGPDEEDEVERFRLALKQSEGRSESFAVFSTAAVDDYDRVEAQRAYIRYRSAADLQLITLVLADPSRWQLGTNLPTRSDWRARSAEERHGLDHLFDRVFTDLSGDSETGEFFRAVVDGPQALLDASLSLLNWVRALESVMATDISVADIRLRVYEVLARATDARDLCLRAVLDDAERLDAASSPARLADTVLATWIRENSAAVDAAARHWAVLDECLDALRAASPGNGKAARDTNADSDTNTNTARAWEHVPWSGIPMRRQDFEAVDLAPFLAAMGIPEPISALAFWRITGDEPAARPGDYTALLERKTRRATRAALSLPAGDIDRDVLGRLFGTPLTSRDKLAGTTAVNFGGFLARGWRANDWWWGRLDAAAGMTRFVDSYPPIQPAGRRKTDPSLIDAVQSSVLADAAASPDRPFSADPGETAPSRQLRSSFTRGGNTLGDLSPAYLLSVLSRSIRVTSRAISGSTSTPWRLILALLRPLFVFVPLLATPVRAGIAVLVLNATIVLSASSPVAAPPGAGTVLVGAVILAAVFVGLVVGLGVAVHRWRRLIGAIENADAAQLEDSTPSAAAREHAPDGWPARALSSALALRTTARWQAVTCAVGSCATLGVAALALVGDGLDASFWVLAHAAVLLAALALYLARSPSDRGTPALTFCACAVGYAAWIALVLALPGVVADLTAGGNGTGGLFGLQTSDLVVVAGVALAGFSAALLLTVGWLPVRAQLPRTWLLNTGTVSVVAGAAAATVVVVSMLVPGTESTSLNIAVTVVVMVFVWGQLVWWLPEIPEGTSDAWQAAVIPDALRD